MSIEELKVKLSEYGNISVIKADYVFTLLLFSKNGEIGKNTFRIMRLIYEYTDDKYPVIEVIRNEENYYMTVLKPKTN